MTKRDFLHKVHTRSLSSSFVGLVQASRGRRLGHQAGQRRVLGRSCSNSSKGARGKASHASPSVLCYRGRGNSQHVPETDTFGNKGRQDRQHQGTRAVSVSSVRAKPVDQLHVHS